MHEGIHRALSHLTEIEAAISGSCPGSDPAAQPRLEALLQQIQIDDSYVAEKRNKLRAALAVFFSAKKWQTDANGERAARMDVGRNIRALREHLAQLEKKGQRT